MKRKIVSIVMASAMVFGLAACGSSGGTTTSSSNGGNDASAASETTAKSESSDVVEGSSDDDNTLTVWTWDPNFNVYAIKKAAEIYAQDHEGFKVEVSEVQSDDIETRLTTAVSAGDLSTLPDIFLMQDNSFQKYATNYPDIFTDLTDSGIDFSEFSSAKVAYSTLDGKNYGIPFDNGAVIECLRTDMLEQAGFTVDDFTDITWNDFMEKAKVVKNEIRSQLNQRSIRYNWHEPDVTVLEGFLARGDRRCSKVILKAYEKGALYDAWSESFHYDIWKEAFKETGVDIEFYTLRERSTDEILPWDFIDAGVTKKFLIHEWEH